jgi:hypothetical protein
MSDTTPRPRPDPSYRKHKQSGQIVTLSHGYGGRRDFLLGKYGTKESRAAANAAEDQGMHGPIKNIGNRVGVCVLLRITGESVRCHSIIR